MGWLNSMEKKVIRCGDMKKKLTTENWSDTEMFSGWFTLNWKKYHDLCAFWTPLVHSFLIFFKLDF